MSAMRAKCVPHCPSASSLCRATRRTAASPCALRFGSLCAACNCQLQVLTCSKVLCSAAPCKCVPSCSRVLLANRACRALQIVLQPRYQGKVSGQMGTVITKPQLEGNKDCDCVLEVLNEQLAEERSKQARQHKDMHGANWHTVSDEDISLPGPSSPAPAVPPQVMHTPKTIERWVLQSRSSISSSPACSSQFSVLFARDLQITQFILIAGKDQNHHMRRQTCAAQNTRCRRRSERLV